MDRCKGFAPAAGMLVVAWALAACGGGGGGGSGPPPPPPDARNGSYTLIAADAREYTLALDFDAQTYRVTGAGIDQSGAIMEQAGTFFFQPGNATGPGGSSTTRFQMASDAVVGGFTLPTGAQPFLAARRFVNTAAAAAGTYNVLGRIVDTAGGAPNTSIQQAEITADGRLRVCEDQAVNDMANCTSVSTGPLTVNGDVFTAAMPGGGLPFRVAQVGADKVFLRASVSVGSTRRLMIGTPARASFSGGTFPGAMTEPAWGTVTVDATSFASSGTTPSGATGTMTGTAVAVSGTVPGIRFITTASPGSFFAAVSSEIGIVVAASDSTSAPGFLAIGRKQ